VQTGTEALHTENQNEDALLTPENLANYLQCGRTYAYQLLCLGEISSLRLGKLRRIRRSDAQLYVEKKVSQGHER
jgi:excisionase family DNA binding protein